MYFVNSLFYSLYHSFVSENDGGGPSGVLNLCMHNYSQCHNSEPRSDAVEV